MNSQRHPCPPPPHLTVTVTSSEKPPLTCQGLFAALLPALSPLWTQPWSQWSLNTCVTVFLCHAASHAGPRLHRAPLKDPWPPGSPIWHLPINFVCLKESNFVPSISYLRKKGRWTHYK